MWNRNAEKKRLFCASRAAKCNIWLHGKSKKENKSTWTTRCTFNQPFIPRAFFIQIFDIAHSCCFQLFVQKIWNKCFSKRKENKKLNWIMCFFPSADFEGENSATQSVVLSENGGKGFVKLGCDKQLRRSKASETKCGNGRIMGCQHFLMQSFKTWINIRWWKQSFCHRKIFLFFLAALSPKIHPARLVFDRCWAEVFSECPSGFTRLF